METITINTTRHEEIRNMTTIVQAVAVQSGWRHGAVMLFCPHTTCGLTINEGADPAVQRDLMKFFREIAPHRHGWEHCEGNTDAHIRASILGSSLLIPIENGQLCLGTWQSIYLYEGDGPRQRKIWLQNLQSC